MWTIEEGTEKIRSKGLKITSQRVGILKVLKGRKDHPSAEQVFREMKKDHPTISFATIYSTAQILEDAGLLQILTIDGHRVFFDPNPEPHAHYRCRKCGHVFDIPLPSGTLKKITEASGEIVESIQVYCYGTCSACISREREKDREPVGNSKNWQ
ncbi:MAG TPA: Fur family transcriptional regulator [Synergistales bacterium]|jgi:Fur family peroxide stress response transcriptional regulator|nr:Fur family transcriptional regulator [Synergistales bacterium]HRV70672.1 Fur family transcriptional regulator [Thermovirgaceae bacterium]